MPRLTGVLETALPVEDTARAARFYQDLFGFATLDISDRLCALSVEGRQVLLLFKKGASVEPTPTAGGRLPGGITAEGASHLAFAVPAEELPAWERRLAEKGIPILSRIHWERGGQSIYFHDLDQHVLELATPGTWEIY